MNAVVASIVDSWLGIRSWLETRAPATFAALAPSAPSDEIRAVRDDVGQNLPDDLVAWWQLCGGTRLSDWAGPLLPPFYEPCSLRQVLAMREFAVGSGSPTAIRNADAGEAGSLAGAFLASFVPIAADGGGDYLFVDLRAGALHGCIQHWSGDDGANGVVWWTGVAEMLADVADALRTGSEARRGHVEAAARQHFQAATSLATVSDGRLAWEPTPVDPPLAGR
ncbi:SMI1/KNR4 family protein [Actinosynnema sp. NPDC023587]|uniref:SMI1/KNR4 family protein n=1 Tax=Actinosynnema sp. NPDC023587 TaxID=3154695 RepID=UPI0033EDBDC0